MDEPETGATATASMKVRTRDLASVLPLEADDAYPAVLATSRMIALMEIAASRILRPLLRDGELSVGVHIDVEHMAPTPVGASVIATARYVRCEGKVFVFEVSAADPAGEIGKGVHKRAIVSEERLMQGAAKRSGPSL